MKIRTASLVVAALTACTAPAAHAVVTVTSEHGEIVENARDTLSGKWAVTVRATSSAQPTEFLITGANNDHIEYIRVEANNPGQVVRLVVKGLNDAPKLRQVDLIERSAGPSDVWILDLKTTGDVGDIRVNTIVSADIGGDLVGDVTMLGRTNGGESSLENMIVRGDVLGDIRAPSGSIFNLRVEGQIGTPQSPSVIAAANRIGRLVAGDVFGNIFATAYTTFGFCGHIEITTALGGGVFEGALTTSTFFSGSDPGLFVDGDLRANIAITNAHNVPGAQIVLPAGGLRNQISINTANSGGTWSQPIKIGPDGHPNQVILDRPWYSPTAAQIGGGAVGLVPYRLHYQSCTPNYGGVLTGDTAIIRFYGPVTWQTGAPLIIEERFGAAAWSIATGRFLFAAADSGREIRVTAAPGMNGFIDGAEYRVRPVRTGPSAIKSAYVAGEPVILDFELVFSASGAAPCPADMNGDGVINSADLGVMLGAWGPCGVCPTDLNSDGNVGSADLGVMLGSWGPCQ
ncbi:MAG: hypothetical protein VYC34_10955 [Planctomycetota bacterium]|nr:hypothetical protein [Planctomycetota bacterium]